MIKNNLTNTLKQYDSFLKYEKRLDGMIKIIRNSVFNACREYPIFTLENRYIGSGKWVRSRLIMSDTQRTNIFAQVKLGNERNRRRDDGSKNMSRELGKFIFNNEKIIL